MQWAAAWHRWMHILVHGEEMHEQNGGSKLKPPLKLSFKTAIVLSVIATG